MARNRYTDLNTYFRALFGERVHKLTVDAGFGCPNRDGTVGTDGCIYCNARGSGTGWHRAGKSIAQQLTQSLGPVAKRFHAKKFIAYFQSYTNTYAPVEVLRRCYDEALSVPGVMGLAIGTRPDCVDDARLALLESYARRTLVWVEYGLQSAHDRTLEAIGRGHDAACFFQAVERTRGRGIRICAHVILGLPGEDRADMRATAEALAASGIDGIKLHLLYVIRGTPLHQWYQSGRYIPMTQTDYVEAVCDTLERLPAGVVIQRLTGDPHPAELIAPDWALDKRGTRERIHRRLEERDTWQGKCLGAPRPDLSE